MTDADPSQGRDSRPRDPKFPEPHAFFDRATKIYLEARQVFPARGDPTSPRKVINIVKPKGTSDRQRALPELQPANGLEMLLGASALFLKAAPHGADRIGLASEAALHSFSLRSRPNRSGLPGIPEPLVYPTHTPGCER